MGITNNNLKFLVENLGLLKKKKIITIGRQQKYFDIKKFFDNKFLKTKFCLNNFEEDHYIDNVLKCISDNTITSVDFSDDRGKTNIKFNLNNLLPKKYHNKFDVLIDGGSLEHILDLKNCIQNYKNLVKKNGHLFIFTTANNYFGHGFYQFSLEFFNNIFSKKNGFKILDILLCEHNFPGAELSKTNKWYRPIFDKNNKYKRFSIINDKPLMVYALVKKINKGDISFNFIQSDYLGKKTKQNRHNRLRNFILKKLKDKKDLFDYLYGLKQKKELRLSNKKFFKKY